MALFEFPPAAAGALGVPAHFPMSSGYELALLAGLACAGRGMFRCPIGTDHLFRFLAQVSQPLYDGQAEGAWMPFGLGGLCQEGRVA